MGGCRDYATIMRTPVHDDLLALGFLFSEGVVKVPGDVRWMRYAGSEADKESSPKNALEVGGVRSVPVGGRAPRLVESSCGICGKRA
ncbi:formate dehydrogenase accessory sulfurtransferase FdhD [Thermogymnomonas acidicola]|uniref:formate dehydrogenase accessory sulfurtransferase FdhD n=1 Tax=Thermogymnomonas acidicola TaxID=399579 RepID=UPI0009467C73|nr:formate dehydrogenase accessory sulfurtransferase FdhD [Thermogymnomonas acidicola]